MPVLLPTPASCCTPCDEPVVVNVPGPQGEAGADGADGVEGRDAFGTLQAQFVQPAVGDTVAVTLDQTYFLVAGTDVAVEVGGYYKVSSVLNGTVAILENRGYDANVPPGTTVPASGRVSLSGLKGEAGADGSDATGDVLAANKLSEYSANAADSLANLGASDVGIAMLQLTDPSAITFPKFNADNSVSARTASQMRSDLGLDSMAVQDAAAVAITGGTAQVVLGGVTPKAATVTTLETTGELKISNTLRTPASALQTLGAANTISANAARVRVVGNGGAVTLTTTPTIAAPITDGQRLLIQGTDDANTLTVQDDGSLAGSKLQLGAASRTLGKGDTLELIWDLTDGYWYELNFSAL